MAYDPITEIIDEPLHVSPEIVQRLVDLRARPQFTNLPGLDIEDEQKRLSQYFNDLLDRLIADLANNPNKLWVMRQFQIPLLQVNWEDTEARDHFGLALEEIMNILEIDSSDGLLSFYLG